ncbi:hypothetical protein JTB14_000334 [Gonioctena quinquepunctata]|nr:hypothetical protein JTB14_000334 [Gonioctena quinquepunctata]
MRSMDQLENDLEIKKRDIEKLENDIEELNELNRSMLTSITTLEKENHLLKTMEIKKGYQTMKTYFNESSPDPIMMEKVVERESIDNKVWNTSYENRKIKT